MSDLTTQKKGGPDLGDKHRRAREARRLMRNRNELRWSWDANRRYAMLGSVGLVSTARERMAAASRCVGADGVTANSRCRKVAKFS